MGTTISEWNSYTNLSMEQMTDKYFVSRKSKCLALLMVASFGVLLPTKTESFVLGGGGKLNGIKCAAVENFKNDDWNDRKYHQYSSKQSELDKSKGTHYQQSVLNQQELDTIHSDVSTIISQMHQETSSIALNRMGASFASNSDTNQILRDGSLCRLVRRVTGDDTMRLSNNIPVQVRSYEKTGASMAWHQDDVLYDPPQIEAVLTLENTSDCLTMWKDGKLLHSKETDPNSVLLLKAGGPLHCVTSLKRGKRVIIKCAYVPFNAKFREGVYTDQFPPAKNQRRKSKRRKR